MYKPTILVDLDGVINNYNKYTDEIPDLRDGAKEFIEKLYNLNKYQLVLFTTRNLLQATKWLIVNKIDKYFNNATNVKIPSYLQIDDRAICFKGDYNKTFSDIQNFEVYWKKE